ncbi:MAG TPA: hypothetical protein DDW81_02745 [Cryomorphaceae bacterium]|nr:hypothetical protein [Owenweeksia sp.]HBF18985.1 hypothetical protein [Cryomorphaceae bacterium]|tara:strand:+ start:118 stop:534 length:417 start_codon:yes stop_codon:yes gene_type:complete
MREKTEYNGRKFLAEKLVLELVYQATDVPVQFILSPIRKETVFRARCLVYAVLTNHQKIGYSNPMTCEVLDRTQANGLNLSRKHLNYMDTDKSYGSIFAEVMRAVDIDLEMESSDETTTYKQLENELISYIDNFSTDE